MGSSRWDPTDWGSYTRSTASKSAAQIFTSTNMKDEYNPKMIDIRESRDSAVNPNSNAIIIGSDVTGSMGHLAETLIRSGIGTVFEEILDRQPVSDPHLMVMGIGDVYSDSAPLQCTQFEADITIAKQLEDIWIEGNGGGNGGESYNLAWYFATHKTEIDCFEKRGKKGYLFTIGDEPIHPDLKSDGIQKVFGEPSDPINNKDLLTLVSRKYEVFHILVNSTSYSARSDRALSGWRDLLGERAIILDDSTKLAEVIVSAIEINEGHDADTVVSSWDGDTSLVVGKAVGSLSKKATSTASGVVRL